MILTLVYDGYVWSSMARFFVPLLPESTSSTRWVYSTLMIHLHILICNFTLCNSLITSYRALYMFLFITESLTITDPENLLKTHMKKLAALHLFSRRSSRFLFFRFFRFFTSPHATHHQRSPPGSTETRSRGSPLPLIGSFKIEGIISIQWDSAIAFAAFKLLKIPISKLPFVIESGTR